MRLTVLSFLTILCATLAAPAFGGVYDNGPTNYNYDAYSIDVYAVSDSFTVFPDCSEACTFQIALWVPTGATPLTVDWSIGTSSFGSNMGSGVGWTESVLVCGPGCNHDSGHDLYYARTFIGLEHFAPGTTYWLTLTGATDSLGGRDGWDINSGPSQAFHNVLGAVPSEAFTISQCPECALPEPGSIILFGSGVLGFIGVFGRRLR